LITVKADFALRRSANAIEISVAIAVTFSRESRTNHTANCGQDFVPENRQFVASEPEGACTLNCNTF
jgi:hypothetical protein